MHDCITDPPKEPGEYNVSIKGIMTVAPIFWEYDGKTWKTNGYFTGPLKPGDAWWYDNASKI
jgi:hypothetical protein